MSGKIYIIDDDPVICSLLSETLKIEGADIITFNAWEAASKELEKNSPKLIIVDYQMPKINGIEVAKLVLANEKHKYTKIILLSGNEECEKMVNKSEINISAVIRKPFKIPELNKQIIEILNEITP